MGETIRDTLTISSDTRMLIKVREFLSAVIRRSTLSAKDENKVILAVDEAVSNIIEHGYEHHIEDQKIEIEVECDEDAFRIHIRDFGKAFNPDDIEDPDLADHVRRGRRKGLGIFLMRQIMDEVKYVFKQGVENELLLVKYIRPPQQRGPAT